MSATTPVAQAPIAPGVPSGPIESVYLAESEPSASDQRPLIGGLDPEDHYPVYLVSHSTPPGYDVTFTGLAYMVELGLIEADRDSERSLEDIVAGLTLYEPQRNGDADRVVSETETCDCGRPAGADGLCEPCRRTHAGETIGNHGGRL